MMRADTAELLFAALDQVRWGRSAADPDGVPRHAVIRDALAR
jgi:hypothetical protein